MGPLACSFANPAWVCVAHFLSTQLLCASRPNYDNAASVNQQSAVCKTNLIAQIALTAVLQDHEEVLLVGRCQAEDTGRVTQTTRSSAAALSSLHVCKEAVVLNCRALSPKLRQAAVRSRRHLLNALQSLTEEGLVAPQQSAVVEGGEQPDLVQRGP